MGSRDNPTAEDLMRPVGPLLESSEKFRNIKDRCADAVSKHAIVMDRDEVVSVIRMETLMDLFPGSDGHGSEFVGNLRGEEFRMCRSTDSIRHIMRIFDVSSVNLLVVMDVPGRVDGIIERGDVS